MFSNPFKLPTIADRVYLRSIRQKHVRVLIFGVAIGVMVPGIVASAVDEIWLLTASLSAATVFAGIWAQRNIATLIRYQEADLNIRNDCEADLIDARSECTALFFENASLAQSMAILAEQNQHLRVFMTASVAGAAGGEEDDLSAGGGNVFTLPTRGH